jgi:hypothetical protein
MRVGVSDFAGVNAVTRKKRQGFYWKCENLDLKFQI